MGPTQNPPRSHSHLARDVSNANLTLSYTGGVAAAQSTAGTPDMDDYFTVPSDMHTETVPRSFPSGHPSRIRFPDLLASPFSGDPSVTSSRNYVLAGDSKSGPQNSSIANRQSIDLSGDPSRSTLHLRSDHSPWNPFAATVAPTKAASRQSISTDLAGLPRTPNSKLNPYIDFDRFHDSALGTFTGTGPSHDEDQSLLSPSLTEMDDYPPWMSGLEPQEVERQEEQDEQDQQNEQDEIASLGGEEDDQPPPKQKNSKQSYSKEELTCEVCGVESKTRSDKKKHVARHEAPWKCESQDCPRAIRGFATVNDLNRHEKSVHQKNSCGSKNYKCFAPECPKAEKEWPRLDNFKQHLTRMHPSHNPEQLVQRSLEWFETQYGIGGSTQSAAVAGVLRSQEKAARGAGQGKKRRREDTTESNTNPSKRPRLQTPAVSHQGMPPQDLTLLSPLSAQMTRSPSSASQQRPQPSSMRFSSYQGQRFSPQAQQQNPYTMTQGMPAPGDRSRTAGHARPVMQFQNQITHPFLFTSNELYTFGQGGPATQPSPLDQHSQSQPEPRQSAFQRRPHTAPDGNPENIQTRMALLQESQPIPPGQEDFESFNISQSLAGWGAHQGVSASMPQSSPDTSNGPRTPNQSVQFPNIAVDSESDDEEGKVRALTGLVTDQLAEHVRSFIRQHGTKIAESHRLSTQDLGPFFEFVVSRSYQASMSDVGAGPNSTASNPSSRSGKTNHFCPNCQKLCGRRSDLKKHMKRHSRPYGCVLDNCYKRFGSKNDLKRHETNTHPEQKECYRCDGSHSSEEGPQCFQVFYHGRDSYKKHLEACLTHDSHQIEKKATACRIPANNQGRFWCGFCNRIIDFDPYGPEASTYRLSHIDSHFSNAMWAVNWIELGGNGLSKGEIEINQNKERNQQIQDRSSNQGQQQEGDSQRSSSSSSSLDNQDDCSQSQPVVTSLARPTQWTRPPGMQGRPSNVPRYQQKMTQQGYQQQMAQHMQRARSQGQIGQQAADHRDPPQRRINEHGQRIATRAACCACELHWPLALGRKCTNCDHDLCGTCKVR